MATDTYPHLSLQFGGTLGTPAAEVWSCGMKLVYIPEGVPEVIPYADQALVLDEYVTPLVTWFTAVDTKIANTAKMTWAKLNSIGTDGKYVYPNTTVHDFSGPTGATGAGVDWRQSLCVTMRGPSARGKASVGRFYPPTVLINPATTTSPYVDTTQATAYMTTAKTLIDSLNSADMSGTSLSLPPAVALVGAGDTEKPGSVKAWNLVTYLEVDLVNDSQRRRTNAIARQVVTSNL